MGHQLFRTTKKNDAVLDEEAVKLCPEFAALNSKEVLLLILYVDYFSPYAQIPDQDRLRRAKRHVYGKDDVSPEISKKFLAAVECYRGLQYDIRRETLRKYRNKSSLISEELLNETNNRKISEHHQAIKVLSEMCKELEAEISKVNYAEEQLLVGGKTISFIEQWQKNQRELKLAQEREEKAKRRTRE